MKRIDLIKKLENNGWYLLREGANHTIYTNGIKKEPIPRHREINERLAQAILERSFIMQYIYPVVFSENEEGVLVTVPDLEINTFGDTMFKAIEMARDAISIMLVSMEDDNDDIPSPSSLQNIKIEGNEISSLVDVDLVSYRRAIDNASVKKTLTIPSWLNAIAMKNDINFSQTLQKALKDALEIKD